jgi:biopolymer transport protein ExbD
MPSPVFPGRRRRSPVINVTPLIDVLFLLLIFFMVSSTFRDFLGVDVDLPQAQTAAPQRLEERDVTVTETGAFYFGPDRVDEEGLYRSIEQYLAEEPGARIVLRADKGADWGRVARAMDIARAAGGKRLVMPTQPLGGAG